MGICIYTNLVRVSSADDVDTLQKTGVYIHPQYVHRKCTYVYVLRSMNVRTYMRFADDLPTPRARDNSLRKKRVAIDWRKHLWIRGATATQIPPTRTDAAAGSYFCSHDQ